MKITRKKLHQIIMEEKAKLAEQYAQDFTPQEQAVLDLIDQLEEAIYDMGKSNPEMTDYYVNLFRALQSAGVDASRVAMLA